MSPRVLGNGNGPDGCGDREGGGLVLTDPEVTELVKEHLWPQWRSERDRLDHIDKWYRWQQERVLLPRKATPEHKRLADMSRTPWLNLVVTTVAQCMYVDGYRSGHDESEGEDGDQGPWRTWQANKLGNRQVAIHRSALAYGQAFMTVVPGTDYQGRPTAVMRGASPRNMYAQWEDPAEDDWPRFAMRVVPGSPSTVRVYDDEAVYSLTVDSDAANIQVLGVEKHGAGVCPVVRYANQLDLDGRSPGEVEPFIPAAERINKTAYDRMLVQHSSSWKIRTVSGMSEPDSEEEAVRKKLELQIGDILIAEDPDTKFGTLDETPVAGFVEAWRADIEALAAVTQTPTHALTGQLVNLSAEALAAARASLTQKVTERQRAFGESHVQALRLAAGLEGDEAHADDVMARVTWQDMEIRSMSQAVDALGKAAQMLEVPKKPLWARIPGVEKSDVDEWAKLAEQADPVARYSAELARQASEGPAPSPTSSAASEPAT